MLTKEPEMLQTDAFFVEHTMQQKQLRSGSALNNAAGGVTARLLHSWF